MVGCNESDDGRWTAEPTARRPESGRGFDGVRSRGVLPCPASGARGIRVA